MAFFVNVLDSDGRFDLIDGALAALYPALDVSTLPQLTDAQYQDWCALGDGDTRYLDGQLVFNRAAPDPAAELAAAKAAKLAALNAVAQAYINRMAGIDQLPDFEVRTWTLQALEAKAWAADNNAPTLTLDTIAAARSIPPDILKQKALEKALAFEQLTATVVGLRQAIETRIKKAADMDELAAVEFAFGA